jgi:hypothetical protein
MIYMFVSSTGRWQFVFCAAAIVGGNLRSIQWHSEMAICVLYGLIYTCVISLRQKRLILNADSSLWSFEPYEYGHCCQVHVSWLKWVTFNVRAGCFPLCFASEKIRHSNVCCSFHNEKHLPSVMKLSEHCALGAVLNWIYSFFFMAYFASYH